MVVCLFFLACIGYIFFYLDFIYFTWYISCVGNLDCIIVFFYYFRKIVLRVKFDINIY